MTESQRSELAILRSRLSAQWGGEAGRSSEVDEVVDLVAAWWAEHSAKRSRELAVWLAANRELSNQLRAQLAARRKARAGITDCESELNFVKAELERVYDEMSRYIGSADNDDD